MQWRRNQGWNRSFLGRKHASQPERQVYLRTLSNLSNPSEVRGVLSMSRLSSAPDVRPLTASQIDFARHMLPFRYSEVVDLTSGNKNLLFAAQESGIRYSELHMAAGERSILRLSQEVAQLDGALILIDEVEAGLHPWVQQLLMLQLQQLALRRDLQIIVTSHSPVVLDSVPPNGRIFLERDEEGRVAVGQPYRDLVQNALYGRSSDALNLLCEDEVGESILRGLLDHLQPQLRVRGDSVHIGRDTGASEFPEHAAAFRKFGQIDNFVFVLDGDKRDSDIASKIRHQARGDVPVLFLPGQKPPEAWVWGILGSGVSVDSIAEELGSTRGDLNTIVNQLNSTYDSASDTPSQIAKSKLDGFAQSFSHDAPEVGRLVARLEAGRQASDIQPLLDALRDAVTHWRTQ